MEGEMDMILELNDINKSYGENKVLENVSLKIDKKDIYGIIGLSGEGKSTLVRCINKLEMIDSGTIIFYDQGNIVNVNNLEGKELYNYRKKVSMIFQDFNLLNQLNVFQNIEFPLTLNKGYKRTEEEKKHIQEIISLVGLQNKENSYPSQLSGGQKQRVAIARALINNPEVLLCDECTSALDPTTADQILDLLKSLNKTLSLTIIIIAHQMEVIKKVCNKVAILSGHYIVENKDAKDIFMNPQTEIAKKLIYPNHIITKMHESKLIKLEFNGDVNSPIIANIIRDCNLLISIVYANSWVVEDKAYGQMILKLPYYEQDVVILKQYLDNKKISYQEVNYNELHRISRSDA